MTHCQAHLSFYFSYGFWGFPHPVHVLILSQQIPISLKGVFQAACLRSQPLWKRRLENTTRWSPTVTLAQSKPKGQEHWNTLAQLVDLKTGAGDHAIKSVHSYSSCRNCFSSHIDRERSQVKFYGPFSWLLLPNFLEHKNNFVCFITSWQENVWTRRTWCPSVPFIASCKHKNLM